MKCLILTRGVENQLVEAILDNTDYDVEYAFVAYEKEAEALKARPDIHRVKNLYRCHENLWSEHELATLDYEQIEKYKDLEADFCDGTNRYVNDYNTTKILYYNALGFWLKVFNEHEFDFIVLQELTHGVSDDVIPIGIAKKRGIPCYQIEGMMYSLEAVYLNNTDEYIKLAEPTEVDFAEGMFYSTAGLEDEYAFRRPQNGFRRAIRTLAYKLGGAFGAYIAQAAYKRTAKLYIFNHPTTEHTILDNAISYLKFRLAERYMRKKAVVPDLNSNYVVYYLHVEPEASIMVRCPIKTQLLAIQMLAESLPPGYKLYVKEHPHQGMVNTDPSWDNLYTMFKYKTRKFYRYIAELPNTYLVEGSYSSAEMTKYAKAVSTYHGTVALESLRQTKKPVILFSGNKTIYRYLDGFFSVRSLADCKQALAAIADGYRPDYTYDDFQAVGREYMCPRTSEGLALAVKSIAKHFTENYKGDN